MEEKWVPAMESVINQIINLADALKKLLEQTDLVVRETPKSTKSNQWTIVRPLTRHGGYVETMRRKIRKLMKCTFELHPIQSICKIEVNFCLHSHNRCLWSYSTSTRIFCIH